MGRPAGSGGAGWEADAQRMQGAGSAGGGEPTAGPGQEGACVLVDGGLHSDGVSESLNPLAADLPARSAFRRGEITRK